MNFRNKKKKILYLMHVDWKWIYQRPHIIAKGLEQEYDVTVAYAFNYRRQKSWQKNNSKPKKLIPIFNIPYEGKNIVLHFLNKVWIHYYRLRFSLGGYDWIWLTAPFMLEYIRPACWDKVIYDCMDDEIELKRSRGNMKWLDRYILKTQYIRNTQQLVEHAGHMFVSSKYLYDKYADKRKNHLILVRNGFIPEQIYSPGALAGNSRQYDIGYIGTIADWFDLELLEKSLSIFPEIFYHLIGPCATVRKEHSKIRYEGVVEHSHLYEAIRNCHCLVMPFKVNKIVLAVDPVKLYEYIAYGKCIISVWYPEIERFSEFVYFYRTPEEYESLLADMIDKNFPPKYTAGQQEMFLKENTWENRLQIIFDEIGE